MTPQLTQIRQSYKRVFALDSSKLNRIIAVIESCIEQYSPYETAFIVTLKDGRIIEVRGLEALLGLDNTVLNPISGLEISTLASSASINISFDSSPVYSKFVTVIVSSEDAHWVATTFAQIDEQIERTQLLGFQYKLRKLDSAWVGVFLLFSFAVVIAMVLAALQADEVRSVSLTKAQAASLLASAPKKDDPNANLSWLVELNRQQLEFVAKPRWPVEWDSLFTRKSFFVISPILITLICAIWALRKYPVNVFIWGDWIKEYEASADTRRILWTAVVLAMVVGVFGNFFVLGVTGT